MQRYIRQLALPEIDLIKQEHLAKSCIFVVGTGGLGAPALPYLAGAGVGHIIIADHDNIDITNLHRQTIYTTDQAGSNKAKLCADYLRALNPEIKITAINQKITADNITETCSPFNIDIILDCSDNFETKCLLNSLSITICAPLITASVNQFSGQIGVFKGYVDDAPCYRCLFEDFPDNVQNCNEAGILGTSAGIIGTLQAHITLALMLGIEELYANNFMICDLKTLRLERFNIPKNQHCACNEHRKSHNIDIPPSDGKDTEMIDLISIEKLMDTDTVIVDVRQAEELEADPLQHSLIQHTPLHIPLPELPERTNELPNDKRVAFLCAGNIRSAQAARYMHAHGHDNVCVLDKFSI